MKQIIVLNKDNHSTTDIEKYRKLEGAVARGGGYETLNTKGPFGGDLSPPLFNYYGIIWLLLTFVKQLLTSGARIA